MTSTHKFKKAGLTAVVAAALVLGLSVPASATLIGDTITVTSQANFPVDTWSDTVLVGAGIELAGGGTSNHANTNQGQGFAALFAGDFIDIGANSITFNFAALGAFGFNYAFVTDFLDLDWTNQPGTLQSVAVAPGAMGLLGSSIGLVTPNSFQFQGTVDLVNGANFRLDLTAVHNPGPGPGPAPVPEPATLPLFAVSLMGLIYCLRRRKVTLGE